MTPKDLKQIEELLDRKGVATMQDVEKLLDRKGVATMQDVEKLLDRKGVATMQDVEKLLDRKGFATEKYIDNRLKELEESIKLDNSKTETSLFNTFNENKVDKTEFDELKKRVTKLEEN